MKKLPAYIGFTLLAALSGPARGEAGYYFRHFSVENGLPQNTVSCISQDERGFMWFGTKDGLSRYDGYAFRNFRYDKEDSSSIGNNFIRSIFQAEDGGMWVGTDAGVYIYHPDAENFTRFDLRTQSGIAIEKEVNDIKADRDGNIWLAVDWQGVFCYRPRQRELVFYKVKAIVNAWCLCVDRDNNVWVGTHGGGLSCYSRKSDSFEPARIANGREAESDIYRLFQDSYNDLLIGTANGGVKRLSLLSKQITPLPQDGAYSHLFVRDIIYMSDSELCIGTESGLYIYHTQTHTVKNFCHEYFDPYSLSDNAVYSLYKDREGGLWIGTYFGGVNYYPPQHTPFELFYPKSGPNTVRGKRIREFQQDRYGDLWIGTEDGGLSRYTPATRTFRSFTPDGAPGSIAYHNIHGLLADGDKLWIGTFMHGLNVLDIKTQKVIRRYKKTNDPNSLCDNSVFAIYRDAAQNLWLGTIYGLALYNPQQDNFTKIAYTGDTFIYDIFQSSDGLLWFASFNRGLFRYNPRSEEWKVFRHDPKSAKSLAHDKVISLYEDSKKNLWVTSEGGGFCRYNPEDESFTSYTTKDGLPNDVIYKMLEDGRGRLWLTTNKGLSCFDPAAGVAKTYTLSDGLLGNQFNYKSGIKLPDGRLLFGCLNGFIAFDPLAFTDNAYTPPVAITGFRLLNAAEPQPQLPANAPDEIHLKHSQASFSIDFAALSYTAPEKNRYAYILDGLDKGWTQLTGVNSVTYSNVPPGEYVFRLKGSNSSGKWCDAPATRKIYIHPPFYKTRWAYAVYALLLCCAAAMLIASYSKRQKRRTRQRLELFENEKSKELYNAKISFFTNIAHEIRTPLTLIKGPVEHILTHEASKEEVTENLKVVEKNTNRLLDLSNQLLDFRKVEAKGFQLSCMRSDVKQLISDVYSRFELTARQRNLTFELHLPAESLRADVDREAFTKIISNLFTNAIKYAQSKIALTLERSGDRHFCVKVSNDGKLIPEEVKEKIFEPFFRVDDESGNTIKSGAGLGLPLARSLAELHKGKLYLHVAPGQLNIFVLLLPLTQDTVITVREESAEPDPEAPTGDDLPFKTKPTVLIAEDDREMRHFLCNMLKPIYNVLKAPNGRVAMELLKKENVDIVVTDVMMPEVDGLQLCAEVKSNVDSSHIPVVMLTAKADMKSRIEGLDAGADAYVEKPFSVEHLLAQISNIFTNRSKVKQAFVNSPAQNIGSIALTKADEFFLEKVTQIIDKNLSDVDFSVDALADELHMSRSSLHRKIKGISELTPNDFIQLVRLKKAAKLLQEGSYRVNEICFLVGFGSSSYFSKRFKKQFGVSPKEIKPS